MSSEIQVCLQEFRENLADERVPEHRDSHATSSHELSLDPTPKRSEDLGKHSVYTHFLKDRNCEICQEDQNYKGHRAEDAMAEPVPRAEKFGDLRTADHKVLSGGSESRNNHQYAIVVQDLATQWIQSYPCKKQKLHKKPREACQSSWSQQKSLKSSTLTIPWNLAKLVKIFPGIIIRQHHTDQKQMGLLKEQCAKLKKVPLQYCRNQVWMNIGGQKQWNVIPISETFTDLLSDGKTPYERHFWKTI